MIPIHILELLVPWYKKWFDTWVSDCSIAIVLLKLHKVINEWDNYRLTISKQYDLLQVMNPSPMSLYPWLQANPHTLPTLLLLEQLTCPKLMSWYCRLQIFGAKEYIYIYISIRWLDRFWWDSLFQLRTFIIIIFIFTPRSFQHFFAS